MHKFPHLFLPRYKDLKPVGFELPPVKLKAQYKVQICKDGIIVREPFGNRWFPNLIVNQALDQLMQNYFFYQMLFACKVGSGTNAPAATDTNLQTPTKATSTYTGSGSGTTFDTTNGYATHTQSFEFAAEAGSVTYNELGTSRSTTLATADIWTHALFPSSVSLVSGQNLRIIYSITFSWPATITPVTISQSAINGFNPSGSMKVIGTFNNIFGQLSASGGISGANDAYVRGAYAPTNSYLFSAPATFPAVNTAFSPTVLGSALSGSLGSYTAGSFSRTFTLAWLPSNPSATASNVQGAIISGAVAGGVWGLCLLFSALQTKDTSHTLTFNFTGSLALV